MSMARYLGARTALAAGLMLAVVLLVLVAHVDPAKAAFPGTNGKIAYVKGSSIFTMNPDGGGQSKLTSGNSPSWSADGQKIVFGRYTGQSEEDFAQAIFVMDADGTGERQITSGEFYDFDPSFSPDGETIVFAREIYDEVEDTVTVDVFTVDVDSPGVPTNLTNTQGADEMSPVYSPDGTKIAFTRYGATNAEILVMNSTNGSGKQNLTNTRGADEYDPDWSPDGSKIVFTTYSFLSEEGDGEIAVMDSADGTPRQNLTNNAAHEESPAFSPDGNSIVFSRFSYSRTRGESSDIFVMRADGTTKAKRLTDTRAFEWGPNWGPLPQ